MKIKEKFFSRLLSSAGRMDATQYLIQVQEMPEDSHSQPDPIKTDMSTPQNSDKNVLKYKLSADFHEEVYEDKKYPKL